LQPQNSAGAWRATKWGAAKAGALTRLTLSTACPFPVIVCRPLLNLALLRHRVPYRLFRQVRILRPRLLRYPVRASDL
jgi:hypothetical protein